MSSSTRQKSSTSGSCARLLKCDNKLLSVHLCKLQPQLWLVPELNGRDKNRNMTRGTEQVGILLGVFSTFSVSLFFRAGKGLKKSFFILRRCSVLSPAVWGRGGSLNAWRFKYLCDFSPGLEGVESSQTRFVRGIMVWRWWSFERWKCRSESVSGQNSIFYEEGWFESTQSWTYVKMALK